MENKIYNSNELREIIDKHQSENKKVVWTNGCFDVLHYGHIDYLQKAKSKGDFLIIGVNTDKSVKMNKGSDRPVFKLKYRMLVLQALECVDYLVSFNAKTPYNIIKKIKPDYIAKGGDYKEKDVVGREFVSKVFIIPYIKGFSTTNILLNSKQMIINGKIPIKNHFQLN